MPSTLPAIISSSHRRPLATADRSFVLASARIGLAPLADSLDGWITSRLRRKVRGDQGWCERALAALDDANRGARQEMILQIADSRGTIRP
jgi:hypothetical protein